MSGENGNGDVNPEMRSRMEARVAELRREMAAGEERLRTIDAEGARIRETVLRLEGALLAYGEMLGTGDAHAEPMAAPEVPAAG